MKNFQESKMTEVTEAFPTFNIYPLEEGAISSKIEKLNITGNSGSQLKYGHFKHSNGFLINEESNVIVVLANSNLERQALETLICDKIEIDGKFDFINKKSLSDICYLVRENHFLTDVEFNNQNYQVFLQKASCHGDHHQVLYVAA